MTRAVTQPTFAHLPHSECHYIDSNTCERRKMLAQRVWGKVTAGRALAMTSEMHLEILCMCHQCAGIPTEDIKASYRVSMERLLDKVLGAFHDRLPGDMREHRRQWEADRWQRTKLLKLIKREEEDEDGNME